MDEKSRKLFLRIEEIPLGLEEDERVLPEKIADILKIAKDELLTVNVAKRAIDARNKRKIKFIYSVDVEINEPVLFISQYSEAFKSLAVRYRVRLFEPYRYEIKKIPKNKIYKSPVIVGSGPCGLFAGLVLANAGLKPLIIDRGKDVDSRIKDVKRFLSGGYLDPKSNVQFGEGGAGTFSDGKLYTQVDNPRKKFIFDELIEAGAPKEIAYDAHPHIGTDNLRFIVKNIRKKIIRLGGEMRFETCLIDIDTEGKSLKAAIFEENERVATDDLIIAIGHSARDTYKMLHEKSLEITAKPFAIGLRIEHSAEKISISQYGEQSSHPKLPAAKYKLVVHLGNGRTVYTFCMCPGGYVVAAASEEGGVVTNGMSEYAQNGKNSNCALLVNVNISDFASDHPLAGVEFQRKWEKKAFLTGGGNYAAPAQLVGDFLKNIPSLKTKSVLPAYRPGITLTTLNDCLPDFVIESLREALPLLDKKLKGFAQYDAVLTGVETRSSSPVRLVRDSNMESNICGIYPAGEGAGYAGGIISSALDGMMAAEVVINKKLNE